jgi:hypothetical protein
MAYSTKGELFRREASLCVILAYYCVIGQRSVGGGGGVKCGKFWLGSLNGSVLEKTGYRIKGKGLL